MTLIRAHIKHDGNGRQPCVHCHRRSIAGLAPGQGLCPYHWAIWQWGQQYADRIFADAPPAALDAAEKETT